MTRKELAEALTAHFAEDEEVTFAYSGGAGEVRGTNVEIRERGLDMRVGHLVCRGVRVDWPRFKEMCRSRKGLDGRFKTFEEIRRSFLWVDDRPPARGVERVVCVGRRAKTGLLSAHDKGARRNNDMTRKELVAALEANFAEDEEVTFVYSDDQGEVRETRAEVREHEQETCKGHWEYKGVPVGDYEDIMKMRRTGIDMFGNRCTYSDLHVNVKWVCDGEPVKDKRLVVYIG